MNFIQSVQNLNKFERCLWLGSLMFLSLVFLVTKSCDLLTSLACLVGATALIFVSKGDAIGQLLTVLFALLYAVISFQFRYYGEMITYLGMTAPISLASLVAWLHTPYSEHEVRVRRLTPFSCAVLMVSTILVTVLFYFILRAFHTPNLFFSTISIATSFSASALMLLRSPYYAVAYAANDLVLITLWALAMQENMVYLSMVLCFTIFLVNDLYGFWNWRCMKRRQQAAG